MKTVLVLCSMLAMACAQGPSMASLMASMGSGPSAAGGEASSAMGSMGMPPGLSMSGSTGLGSLMSSMGSSGSGSSMSSGLGSLFGMGGPGGSGSGLSALFGGNNNMLGMMAMQGNGRARNMMKMQVRMNIAFGRCQQINNMHKMMMIAGRLGK